MRDSGALLCDPEAVDPETGTCCIPDDGPLRLCNRCYADFADNADPCMEFPTGEPAAAAAAASTAAVAAAAAGRK